MIALEAIRESIYNVDHDIDDLDACIETNIYDIHDNHENIERNAAYINAIDNEINKQRF